MGVRRSWTAGVRRDRERACSDVGAPEQAGKAADHHRLGVRQHGRHEALRHSGLGRSTAAGRKGQREGRSRRPEAADPDLRYAGEQPCDCEGVRPAPAWTEGQRPLHDLRCRLRCAGRQGGDRPRCPCNRTLYRYRPDGAEAVRPEGAPGVQLRQRRTGRRVGHGPVRAEQGLEDSGPRDRHGHRLLQERGPGVRSPLQAARRARSSPTRRTNRSAGTTCRTRSAG